MDAIALLKHDHHMVEALFRKFELTGDFAQRTKRKIVDEIIVELSRHAAIEEAIFYPACREALGREDEGPVLEALEQQHVMKWTLDELLHMPAEDERFDAKMSVLIANVRAHVKEEESVLFPALRDALDAATLRELGATLEEAKESAPTRPHPRAPDEPPGNRILMPFAAWADGARDLLKSLAGRKAMKHQAETVGRKPY